MISYGFSHYICTNAAFARLIILAAETPRAELNASAAAWPVAASINLLVSGKLVERWEVEHTGSSLGGGASCDGSGRGLALVLQLLADKTRDDLDVERGPVVEINLVDSLEGVLSASVKTRGEFNGGVGARAEIKSSALDLCGCCGIAGGLLSIAVAHTGTGEGSRVGGIGACVVLNGT